MRLHFLVEGPSEEQLLIGLLPRLIPAHTFAIYPHQGKGKLSSQFDRKANPIRRGLLDQAAAKLRAWKSLSPETDRVVLLIDTDDEDCVALLRELDALKSHLGNAPMFIVRFAVEEIEAWYLGDRAALRRTFGRPRKTILDHYRQDSVCGTWEKFREVIGARLIDKVDWATRIGPELAVEEPLEQRNQSPSFRSFCRRIRELAGEPVKGPRETRADAGRSGTSKRALERVPAATARKKRHEDRPKSIRRSGGASDASPMRYRR